jgi:nicotinate-nucleotide adenylyltransferase
LRIGLLGGTFDPIHHAHLRIAEAAAEQCSLDGVLLVPAANPPHRAGGAVATYDDRLHMVEIACAGQPKLEASTLDGVPGKSFSIYTVERLRSSLGSSLRDNDSIFFLIGADAFAELRSWHRWQELAQLVTFAVVDRPGATHDEFEGVHVQRITGVSLPISSSGIREQLAAGNPNVDLPPGVLDYIREHRLYGFG